MKHAALVPEGSELICDDETVLWRGRPSIAGLAGRRLHIRALMGYFVVLTVWNIVSAYRDGLHPAAVSVQTAWIAAAALGVALLVYGAAALLAVTTRYTLTDRRVILQIGAVMPIALTLPLKRIASADLRLFADGSGDLPLTLADGKLAYLLIWPHARPWHVAAPQPMLLGVPDARDVAAILSRALLRASPCGEVTVPVSSASRNATARGDGRRLIGSSAN